MNDIVDFVSRLTKREITAVKKKLKARKLRVKSNTSLLDFFTEITEEKKNKLNPLNKTYIKKQSLTKKIKNKVTARSQKSRLLQIIFDVLSDDYSLYHTNGLDINTREHVYVRKKLAQFILLYNVKGRTQILINMLDKIILKAEKYEVFPVLLDALIYKKAIQVFKAKYSEISEIDIKIELALKKIMLFIEVSEAYRFGRVLIETEKNINNARKYLYKKIIAIENNNAQKLSQTINYFYLLLKISHLALSNQHKVAAAFSIKLIRTVKTQKAVYRKSRLASAYDYAAALNIHAGRYNEAYFHALQASELFTINSTNFFVAKEYAFYALYYNLQYRSAQKLLTEIIRTTASDNKFTLAKYAFYLSCIDFNQHKFQKCKLSLLKNSELSKDKTGWEWQQRVLLILCFIELDEFDNASRAIAALKQQYWRVQSEGTEINKRQKRILKILVKLNVGNYHFRRLKADLQNELLLITKRNAWQPLTPELVRFDVWLKTKLRR